MLEVDCVTKRWDRSVLDGVTLTVPERTLVYIEGANGTGKTTLMRIIAGLLDPDAGTVRFRERPIHGGDRAAFHRQLGLLSAGDRGLYARLDVRQNLRFAASIGLVERSRVAGLVDAAVERFALGEFAGRRVDRLSMGQRQRARLALALLHDPALLLLDEPATSLDADGLELLAGELRRHLDRGGSAVWFGPTGGTRPRGAGRDLLLADGTLTAA